MAMRPNAARPDRQARLLLAALVIVSLAVFGWLVATLTDAAFG